MGGLQQEKGKFPSQPQVNPQGQHHIDTSIVPDTHLEHLKYVTTLRKWQENYKNCLFQPRTH